MKPTTLVFPIDEQNRILLGRKKRGFGADFLKIYFRPF